MNSKTVTIDDAIRILTEARAMLGGDACLILSLTDSEVEHVNIEEMVYVGREESRYVEVRATLPGRADCGRADCETCV